MQKLFLMNIVAGNKDRLKRRGKSMINLQRLSRFAANLAARGPIYAQIAYSIDSAAPLGGEANWNFWTKQSPVGLRFARSYPLKSTREKYLTSMLKADHASGIEAHYDVSNDFYALFLDKKYRFYTCAEFQNGEDTLEKAQERKAEHIRSLLDLEGDEKILELGCGWGSMLKFLRDRGHRGHLKGVTLSKEQLSYVKDTLGLDASLSDFVTDPFEGAPYDRIYSIGAIEHVKPDELEGLYQKIYDALRPGGLSVHQFFSLELEPYPSAMVASQLFFPGSLLVMHDVHVKAAEKAGFTVRRDSIHDYRPTLRAWYERLTGKQEEALKLVDLRTYNRYMIFFPVSWLFFQLEEAKLHRMVLEKPVS
jgi:cyclopropane-fatty-acyl-phospholipid synthase